MVMIKPLELLTSSDQASDSAALFHAPRNPSATAGALMRAGADAMCLTLAFVVTAWAAELIYGGNQVGNPDSGEVAGVLLLVAFSAVGFGLWMAMRGEYSRQPFAAGGLSDVLGTVAITLLATGFGSYLLGFHTGQPLLFIMWGVFSLCMPLARALANAVLHRGGASQWQVLIIGRGETVNHAVTLLHGVATRGISVAGVVDPDRIGPICGGTWSALMKQHAANAVVLAMDEPRRNMIEWLVRDQISFSVVPRQDGSPVQGASGPRLHNYDVALWSPRNNMQRPVSRAAKLAFDVLAAAFLVILLAPVLILIAAIIKLDGGKVFYAHRRIGTGGRSFPCLKFRSMVLDSDAALERLLATDAAAAAEWAASRKLRRDPRITAIGSFLRKTSLDELPQLFNVLRLEMSLVGPRPIVDAEVPRYGEDIHFYYAARPGLTGLWQISGRSDTGYGQRVKYDTSYVKNWSLRHDFMILAKTIPAVLKRQGAV